MNIHQILGVLSSVFVVIGFVMFIFNIRGLLHFKSLLGWQKIIAFILEVLAWVFMLCGGFFAYQNFTYIAPQKTALTRELTTQIKNTKSNPSDYKQVISDKDYTHDSESALFNKYTSKGKADINAYAGNSDGTKSLILRNVGKKLTPSHGATSLMTISGAKVNLIDGKDWMLVFADDSSYSIKQLKILNDFNSDSDDGKVNLNYVVIFPVTSGTAVNNLFKNHSEIGELDKMNVVDQDSMPDSNELNAKTLATTGYSVKSVPSYVTIDSHGVVSNAGIGTIFTDKSSLKTFIGRSFGSQTRLYSEIQGANK